MELGFALFEIQGRDVHRSEVRHEEEKEHYGGDGGIEQRGMTPERCSMDTGLLWHRYIGDAKFGRLVGQDHFGNKYYENTNPVEEVPGRHRWIDFAQHDYNASQVPPEWHSWLGHIRELPPHEDPIIAQSTPPWKTVSRW
jgi:NADH:ubiquinone oxidoreductase subunit